jgi:hypothetical protein
VTLEALLEAIDGVLDAAHLREPAPAHDRPMGPALLRLLAARNTFATTTTTTPHTRKARAA